MENKWLYIFGIIVFGFYVYIHVEYPEECSASLQSMREQNNPEYYILKELRKDK